MAKQKNSTLELLKLFASYMVVFIHVAFYGDAGIIMNTLARFAVPFFFLISGFYSYKLKPEKYKKRIGNIVELFLFGVICYTLFALAPMLLRGNFKGVLLYFVPYLNLSAIFNLAALNEVIYAKHLWYLLAIIYIYIIFYFLTKWRVNERLIFIGSIALLALHILLGEGFAVHGIVVPVPFVRNFALMGVPFFGLGLLAKKYEDKLKSVPYFVVVIALLAGVLESIGSRYLFRKNELYIGSVLMLFAAVVISLKYSKVKYPAFLENLTGCSTYIYIFHIMVSNTIIKIYARLQIDFAASVILNYIHPLFVCLASTVLAYLLIKGKQKISSALQKTV